MGKIAPVCYDHCKYICKKSQYVHAWGLPSVYEVNRLLLVFCIFVLDAVLEWETESHQVDYENRQLSLAVLTCLILVVVNRSAIPTLVASKVNTTALDCKMSTMSTLTTVSIPNTIGLIPIVLFCSIHVAIRLFVSSDDTIQNLLKSFH